MNQQEIDKERARLKQQRDSGQITQEEYIEALEELLDQRNEPGPAGQQSNKTQKDIVSTQQVGHFKLIEALDDGGMGQVWKALDLECQKHFKHDCHRALKFPPPDRMDDPDMKAIIKREAEAGKRLSNCPHTLSVFGAHEEPHGDSKGSYVFMEMEYLEGASFEKHLKTDWKGGLPFERVLELAEQVAQSLDCAHQKKLIHRDLKPANIFLTRQGEVKVLDFGISDEFRRTTTAQAYKPSRVSHYHTPSYMAPEANTKHPKPEQDVHALACVIYELLTGKPSFYTTPDIPRHPSLYPDPPKSLTQAAWEVLKNGFAFEAEKRPASAGELVMTLREAQTVPRPEHKPQPQRQQKAEEQKKPRTQTISPPFAWGKGFAALFVLLLLGMGIYGWNQGWFEETKTEPAQVSSNQAEQISPRHEPAKAAENRPTAPSRQAEPKEAMVETPKPLAVVQQPPKPEPKAAIVETPKPEPPPPAQLVVRSNVYGDQLWIDGKSKGSTGQTVHELEAGEHQIGVHKDGYIDYVELVSLKGRERRTIRAHLTPLPAQLKTESNVADAGLWLDGGYLGKVGESYQLSPGKHRLEARKPGYKPLQKTLTLSPGETLSQRFELEKLPPKPPKIVKPQLPPMESIEGWSANKLAVRRQQTAQALGIPEAYRETLPGGVELPQRLLPGGRYRMGSPDGEGYKDEQPRHWVSIQPFYMGETEVTVAQYAAFLNDQKPSEKQRKEWVLTRAEDSFSNHLIYRNGRYQAEAGHASYPVNNVSWHGAKAFVDWLSRRSGKKYRLPSEAEWEYAARAGSTGKYSWGDEDPVCQKGAYNGAKFDDNKGCDDTGTEAVRFSAANGFGLYDLHGNLWEWVEDCLHSDYKSAPTDGSVWSGGDCRWRVLRGGSWDFLPDGLRAASHNGLNPGNRLLIIGFRVVRSAPL